MADELTELGISAAELARQINVPPNRISQILSGKRIVLTSDFGFYYVKYCLLTYMNISKHPPNYKYHEHLWENAR